ncbi:protein of unknown function [Maridesulfovibrio hydrothermalis AM13 = DSM 14728]|uniref:Uncharacterized protein n=1 Tax=Maridesulfovibrio hydrothermalis AM13 = DSM 14728 TaxID=1121451 RepID=L0REF9_9BACT|nr:protein of unknown function [Maridesulfovibrio hydrothermalis AM13 = DSM 14728]
MFILQLNKFRSQKPYKCQPTCKAFSFSEGKMVIDFAASFLVKAVNCPENKFKWLRRRILK